MQNPDYPILSLKGDNKYKSIRELISKQCGTSNKMPECLEHTYPHQQVKRCLSFSCMCLMLKVLFYGSFVYLSWYELLNWCLDLLWIELCWWGCCFFVRKLNNFHLTLNLRFLLIVVCFQKKRNCGNLCSVCWNV